VSRLLPLPELRAASRARVARVPEGALRARLASLGLVEGAEVELRQAMPAVIVKVGATALALEPAVAAGILVQLEDVQ